MIFVLTWQNFPILLPLLHFFPFSGPALETTLSSSWDMFGNYKGLRASWIIFCISEPCLEQCLIFWLPFIVTLSFVQRLHALMSVSLSGAREAAAGQKSSKDVFALSTSSGTTRGFMRSNL